MHMASSLIKIDPFLGETPVFVHKIQVLQFHTKPSEKNLQQHIPTLAMRFSFGTRRLFAFPCLLFHDYRSHSWTEIYVGVGGKLISKALTFEIWRATLQGL